jgi:hypothetical protein
MHKYIIEYADGFREMIEVGHGGRYNGQYIASTKDGDVIPDYDANSIAFADEEIMEEQVQYALDGEGNQILDENGQPIILLNPDGTPVTVSVGTGLFRKVGSYDSAFQASQAAIVQLREDAALERAALQQSIQRFQSMTYIKAFIARLNKDFTVQQSIDFLNDASVQNIMKLIDAAAVESAISVIGQTDLSSYYSQAQIDSVVAELQKILDQET